MDTEPTYKVAVSRFALDRKLQPGEPFWKDFNGSFKNLELEPMNLLAAIYDGHPFTTWHGHNWRTSANYLCGQHLALDFDTGDEQSTLPHLLKDPFIRKYATFLYTTPSHTEEHPKARVVFLLDQPIMQAKNYALAAQALLWYYSAADRQCKDPARFYYGSKGCQTEYLENIFPLDNVKKLIAQYQESGNRARARQAREWTTPTEMGEVASALDKINPWAIDYGEWVAVLMALHREYGDAALGLAIQWGDGQGDEIERKWAGFNANKPSGVVTLGTVFGLAKRFGWQRPM